MELLIFSCFQTLSQCTQPPSLPVLLLKTKSIASYSWGQAINLDITLNFFCLCIIPISESVDYVPTMYIKLFSSSSPLISSQLKLSLSTAQVTVVTSSSLLPFYVPSHPWQTLAQDLERSFFKKQTNSCLFMLKFFSSKIFFVYF